MCIANYTKSFELYNRVKLLSHYLIRFGIQSWSITILTVTTAQTRSPVMSNTDQKFVEILQLRFNTHKEFYITPCIIILSSLPQFLLAFTFACHKPLLWQRQPLLIVYFLSYVPQLLGFSLFFSFYHPRLIRKNFTRHHQRKHVSSDGRCHQQWRRGHNTHQHTRTTLIMVRFWRNARILA